MTYPIQALQTTTFCTEELKNKMTRPYFKKTMTLSENGSKPSKWNSTRANMSFTLCPTSKTKFGHPATSSTYKLETTSTSKYLGITISSDLSCSTHVKDVAARENRCTPKVKSETYTTMVHPRLEYVSGVWCPHKHKDIQLLEKVQH